MTLELFAPTWLSFGGPTLYQRGESIPIVRTDWQSSLAFARVNYRPGGRRSHRFSKSSRKRITQAWKHEHHLHYWLWWITYDDWLLITWVHEHHPNSKMICFSIISVSHWIISSSLCTEVWSFNLGRCLRKTTALMPFQQSKIPCWKQFEPVIWSRSDLAFLQSFW